MLIREDMRAPLLLHGLGLRESTEKNTFIYMVICDDFIHSPIHSFIPVILTHFLAYAKVVRAGEPWSDLDNWLKATNIHRT